MPDPPAPHIRQLPDSVTVRLRSTLAITSLPAAISELVQNSLDARARNVTVQVNLARNSCVVEDDGVGILPEDVGLVGKMYATSKYPPDSPTASKYPPDSPATFGFRGQALSSLSTHSLFTLTSRHAAHRSTHTTRISYSTPLFAGPAPPHQRLPAQGTTVRVEALHADLPVRFHARLNAAPPELEREWERITWRLAQLLLTPPARGVTLTARDHNGARRVSVRPPQNHHHHHVAGLLAQVYGRPAVGAHECWERVRAVQGPVTIAGHVSRRGHPTREIQFLYVNGHPLPPSGTTALHAEINRVFAASAFCAAKAVERYAMFALWVECGDAAGVLGGEGGTEGKAGLEGGRLAAVVGLLQKLLWQFLKTNHFLPAGGPTSAKRPRDDDTSTPLRTIDHGDPNALAPWSRVKAARADPREEEGRRGTGFPAALAEKEPVPPPRTPDSASDRQVLWRNPVTKRTYQVNSRTGNTAPGSNGSARVAGGGGKVGGPFVEELLKTWKNPVYAETQAPIPTLTAADPTAATALSKLTKQGLSSATVIAQVDRKYILVKMRGLSTASTGAEAELLVLIDQHAASERVRVESLLADMTRAPPRALDPPLTFRLGGGAREAALLRGRRDALARWGVRYHVFAPAGEVRVTALPAAVADRCAAEPALAIALIRRVPEAGGGCPRGLAEMAASRACRGAVMFNDPLGRAECVALVRALAGCSFPFMCAHGRPSMVPLVDLGAGGGGGAAAGGGGFRRDFERWVAAGGGG